jgi:hypothetical protein
MAIVGSEATETAVVRDYLGRLHAAGWGLDPARLDELVADVGAHIDEAFRAARDAGRHGEVVVRNVLERLGPPEEIVGRKATVSPTASPTHRRPAPRPSLVPGNQAGQATAYREDSWWGPVEIFAVLLLSVGSFLLAVVGPIIGVVLVWVSVRWTRPQKVAGSLLGLLPAAWPFFVLFARF